MERVLILDFGGQYNQLIARRVRNLHVYAEIVPFHSITLDELRNSDYKGIIFTGGPNSVYDPSSPHFNPEILNLGIPILGICYGCQLIAYMAGGVIEGAKESSEYGRVSLHTGPSVLYEGIPDESIVWMSHMDYVSVPPEGYTITGTTARCPCASMENAEKNIYGVQFHPEVTHSQYGPRILSRFLFQVCGCKGEWKMESFVENTVARLRQTIGDRGVVLGLSGGVDSSVTAALLSRAIGKQLTCVFVDHGLMRKNEGDFVEETFTGLFDMNFVRVNCQELFLDKLRGISDPEEKRKVIGTQFYKVFWEEIRHCYNGGFFAQGTIYPDRIESGKGDAATIKTHHNQVKMPEDISFEGILEPLQDLFKDEVRAVGEQLGLPHELVYRQPFPGPGLGVRVMGEVTEEKLLILQEADWVLQDEISRSGYDERLAQFFAVLPDVKTVGVMGDHRTYEHMIAIRAITTDDFMTADWAKIPYDLLGRISSRITNEVEHVNRVVYDITQKPPATVEYE